MTGISKKNGDLPEWEVSAFRWCGFGSILRLIADEYAEGFLRSVLLPLRSVRGGRPQWSATTGGPPRRARIGSAY